MVFVFVLKGAQKAANDLRSSCGAYPMRQALGLSALLLGIRVQQVDVHGGPCGAGRTCLCIALWALLSSCQGPQGHGIFVWLCRELPTPRATNHLCSRSLWHVWPARGPGIMFPSITPPKSSIKISNQQKQCFGKPKSKLCRKHQNL